MTTSVLKRASAEPLLVFTAVALPVGWVLLSIPLFADLPVEPFILGTLFLGLVLPTVLLTRPSVKRLLVDTVRPPRPLWLLIPAAALIPVVTGVLTGADLTTFGFTNVLSSLLIINLWEEMAWAGFVQRRATARFGYVPGSVLTALLFTAVHLPLAFYGSGVAHNVAVMIVSGIGLRLLIGAFDVWGRGSILALGLIHATFNATGDLVGPADDRVRYAVTFGLGLIAAFLVTRRAGR
ncbi:CPBP family intramembrane glutamic endopeptidase [Actinoplanes sp. NPDC051633]|uniref:CPBP family intramembrane glutamic endopeptidase n=1 Tax=Actinoplanes sp. NPDC051633 TaxID=3155670 RepID=UPI00342FAC10